MRCVVAVVAALLLVSGATAESQDAPARATVRLEVDNDLLALRGAGPPPDYDYTHGTRVVVAWPAAPRALAGALRAAPRCASSDASPPACLLSALAVGQEIYTPRHDAAEPVPGDRPHAAWLYGAARVERLQASAVLQSLELRAGVTGRPALGEQVQNGVHRLLGNHFEAGWSRQLPTRLGVSADYGVTRAFDLSAASSRSRIVAGSAGATVGTLRRAARAGASAHYAFGREEAWSADAPLVARPARFHLTAGVVASLVQHDAFIEGMGGVAGAERVPWVNEAYAGVGWRRGRLGAEYRYTTRGRDYRSQPGRHAYGSVALSLRP